MRRVLHIVPRFSPSVSGVGDYARLLGAKLLEQEMVESSYLVADPSWSGSGASGPGGVWHLPNRSGTLLAAWLPEHAVTSVLLHFVGYGYQKRGCPLWLLNGLRLWQRRERGNHLTVMFHELSAFGPPWRSSFWCAPVQRFIARQLALLARTSWTNTRKVATRLEQWMSLPRERIRALPVFSSVGEPREDMRKPLVSREPWLAIFGGSGRLDAAITRWRKEIESVCRKFRIEKILAIGPKGREPWNGAVPLLETGVLPSEQVRSLLLESRFGFLDYFNGYLAKSTIFAAYCAHGVAPLFATPNNSQLDGIYPRTHYLTVEDVEHGCHGITEIQSMVENTRTWYKGHDLSATASFVAQIL